MDLVGQRVGNYQLVRLLGEGGMGVVYEAVHPVLGRRAAIKILKLGAGAAAVAREVERFFTEARLVASLGHANIVEAFDFGEVSLGAVASYYVAMELLEGEPLRARIARGALPLSTVLALGQQAAAALGAAHGRGVVHRDVKPDNLFLTRKPDGREVLKVLDFGIAKLVGEATSPPGGGAAAGLTASGILLGTPAYMSPEQCAGRPLDARADVYSLGLVLYEAATGKRAFVRETEPEVMAAQVRDPPPLPSRVKPDVPAAFEGVILRALAKKPELRFESMAAFGAALARLEAGGAAAPSRAEIDGLLEACTATRAIDARGGAAGRPGATLPLYAPAAAEAVTHTAGRIDGPAPLPGAPAGAAPAPATAARHAAGPLVAVAALGVVAVAAFLLLALPRLRGPAPPRPTPPPAARPAPEVHPVPASQPQSAAAPQPGSQPPPLARPLPPSPPHPTPHRHAPAPAPAPAPAHPEPAPPAAVAPVGRAHLAVHVAPWAKVSLDGAPLGETPIDRDVAAGAHTLVLSNDGLGKEERIPLKLQPGERKRINRRWGGGE